MIPGRERGFAVLGIDAAWTSGNPSGVALVAVKDGHVRAIAASPSYEAFIRCRTDWLARQAGGLCDAGALFETVRQRTKLSLRCVAVDMALSRVPIKGRRPADNEVSRAFGSAWCGTHSPNPDRPGEVSRQLVRQFESQGFALATLGSRPRGASLIEVHPHAALVRLMGERKRLPYKISRLRQYYPDETASRRRVLLSKTWQRILEALNAGVEGSAAMLPEDLSGIPMARLKAAEDTLDALICAWIGVEFVRGRTEPFGDEDAAIWVPRAAPRS